MCLLRKIKDLDFPSGSDSKDLPAMEETQVQSLGQDDSLEKETATHSNILTWETAWTEEPGRLPSMGSQKSQTQLSDWACTVLY